MKRRSVLLVALALSGCSPAPKPAPPVAAADDGSGSGAPGAEALVNCRLVVAETQVETRELRSQDGSCRLILPLAVTAGRLPIRVAAAPGEAAASFEVRRGTETFYASEGEVVVERSDASGFRGTVAARDANPPGLARLTATIALQPGVP